MTTVAAQVQYESGVRFRFGALALLAAILLVASQLIQLTGVHAPVNELTLDLIAAAQRRTSDIVGAALDFLGLIAVGVLLYWLHAISRARRPEYRVVVRWLAVVGAVLSAVMAILYTVIVAGKAHTFVTTGLQSYPEANNLTGHGLVVVLPLLLELGTLLLAIGTIWISLSVMRVGLVTRFVGYIGVIAGALFLFPIGGLVPVVQGVWLACVAVTCAKHWPQGDPPAWAAGVAVPWQPLQSTQARQAATRRPARGQRRRVSDEDVLEATETHEAPPNPGAGRSKRKRRR